MSSRTPPNNSNNKKWRVGPAITVRSLAVICALSVLFILFLVRYINNRRYARLPQTESVTYSLASDINGLQVEAAGPRTSVLLITVDTLRPDYLSANGYGLNISPNIDALIQNGIYFSHAMTPIPRTSQALAALLTGCYPYRTEVRSLWDALSPRTVTMAEILHKSGYRTIAVVSNHVLSPQRKLYRGFETYDYGTDKRSALQTTNAALAQLNKIKVGEPFFLWIHYIDPHVPYYPPKDLIDRIDPEYQGRFKYHFGDEPGGIGEKAYPRELGKERVVYHNDLPNAVNEHIRKLYAADIASIDSGIKALMDGISNRPMPLILFTADHGESLGEHEYYYDHGDYLYDPELRVPLAFILPKGHHYHKRGRASMSVSLVDVLPTLLDLLGIRVSSDRFIGMDGASLLPYWLSVASPEKPVFAESDDSFFPGSVRRKARNDISGRFRSVVLGKWKLIWTPFQTKGNEFELYDLDSDPSERTDLSNSENSRLNTLNRILMNWMGQQPQVHKSSTPSGKDIEVLRSLGYLGAPIKK